MFKTLHGIDVIEIYYNLWAIIDNAKQPYHIWVLELCHNGCFLEKLNTVTGVHSRIESFNSNITVSMRSSPNSCTYSSKLAMSNFFFDSIL